MPETCEHVTVRGWGYGQVVTCARPATHRLTCAWAPPMHVCRWHVIRWARVRGVTVAKLPAAPPDSPPPPPA